MKAALLLALAACNFQHGAAGGGSGDGSIAHGDASDPPRDAKLGDPDGFDAACFGSAPFSFCLAAPPSGSLELTGDFATGSANDSTCEASGMAEQVTVGGTTACAIRAASISVDDANIFRAQGALPLVIVASGDISIAGVVTVGSDTQGHVGAGANAAACVLAGVSGSTSGGCGGGGAGGSYGTAGGGGGEGNSDGASQGIAAAAASSFDVLRGGCAGAAGGTGGGTSGAASAGGGAVFVIARGGLSISGTIDASGSGGAGASPSKAGGGGGGSGGMIVVAAASLDASGAHLVANGGGAGGGADAGNSANPGNDPSEFNVTMQAAGGGGGGAAGGKGGAGGAGGSSAVNGENAAGGGGGGGGGGGQGVIRVLGGGSLTGAQVSPSAI